MQDRQRQQQAPAALRLAGSGLRRLAGLGPPRVEQQRQHRGNNQTQHCRAEEGAAPAGKIVNEQERSGRRRAAEHAGEGMDGKSLRHALGRHALRQQRVVGRVIDGIGQTGDAEHGDEDPEGIHRRGDSHRHRAERDAGDEQRLGADAVDQKARGRLQQRRHHIEGDIGEAELSIADAIVGADEDKERRQDDDVIVADEMRRADQRDLPVFLPAFGQGREASRCCGGQESRPGAEA